VGWTDFARQNAPSLGSFLEGAFAPLAEAGESCNDRGMIAEALRDGAHGRVARLMKEVAPTS
jgi:hypothetical protein